LDCGGKAGVVTPLSGGRNPFEPEQSVWAHESGVALRFPPQSKTLARDPHNPSRYAATIFLKPLSV